MMTGDFLQKRMLMEPKPFKSTELKEAKEPAFINGDDAAESKVLTSDHVARSALRAVFRDRPSYFSTRTSESSTEIR